MRECIELKQRDENHLDGRDEGVESLADVRLCPVRRRFDDVIVLQDGEHKALVELREAGQD